jgi:hypothetical protein
MPIDTDLLVTIDAMVQAVAHEHDFGRHPVSLDDISDRLEWSKGGIALEKELQRAINGGRLGSRKGPDDFDPVYWVVHN